MNIRHLLYSITLIFTFFLSASTVQAVELKCASLAPVGSSYANRFTEFADGVTKGTGNAVKITLYNGGVMGDEKDMVKKLRIGQLDCAGFTGVGLGLINPAVRVMEVPFLFSDYTAVDKAFSAVDQALKQLIKKKGFELLGWAHPGFVKLYSKDKIASKKDMGGKKVWIWAGDPIAESMTKNLGLNAVPLSLPDVLTSLQTGMIDTVYAPELAAVALQWYTKTKYISDINLVHSMGGLVITNKALKKLNASQQKVMRNTANGIMDQLTIQTRSENEKSLKAMLSSGLKLVPVAPDQIAELKKSGEEVEKELTGSMFPANLLNQVKSAL